MSKQDKDKEKVLLICQDCGAEFELSNMMIYLN